MARRRGDEPVAHLLPVFDFSERAWLLRNQDGVRKALADIPIYSRRSVLRNRALAITSEWIHEVRSVLLKGYFLCRSCSRGEPCEAWLKAPWDDDYFVPRAPSDRVDQRWSRGMFGDFQHAVEDVPVQDACGVLGLAWPCTTDQLAAAYRPLVRVHHPDLGGTTEAIVRINTARDTVRRALEASP